MIFESLSWIIRCVGVAPCAKKKNLSKASCSRNTTCNLRDQNMKQTAYLAVMSRCNNDLRHKFQQNEERKAGTGSQTQQWENIFIALNRLRNDLRAPRNRTHLRQFSTFFTQTKSIIFYTTGDITTACATQILVLPFIESQLQKSATTQRQQNGHFCWGGIRHAGGQSVWASSFFAFFSAFSCFAL